MPHHHPSDTTLLRYAAGTLDAGAALVVDVHLEHCTDCAQRVDAMMALGGAHLACLPPEAMAPDALSKALARLDTQPTAAPVTVAQARLDWPQGLDRPAALLPHAATPWKRLGKGVAISRLNIPNAHRDMQVFLLRTDPGRTLPRHGHEGYELTCVLSGRFSDSTGSYGPGDLAEMGSDVHHQAVAEGADTCICLIALHGRLRLDHWLGRLLQPLAGF